MKTLLLIIIAILLTIAVSGCTMQFKAKEIELEGHSYTEYDLEKLAWTKDLRDLPAPSD